MGPGRTPSNVARLYPGTGAKFSHKMAAGPGLQLHVLRDTPDQAVPKQLYDNRRRVPWSAQQLHGGGNRRGRVARGSESAGRRRAAQHNLPSPDKTERANPGLVHALSGSSHLELSFGWGGEGGMLCGFVMC